MLGRVASGRAGLATGLYVGGAMLGGRLVEALLLRDMKFASTERRIMAATLAGAIAGLVVGFQTRDAWARLDREAPALTAEWFVPLSTMEPARFSSLP